MNYKYNLKEIVLIYNCPALVGGGIGRIIDRDKFATDYLIQDFTDPGRPEMTRWVSEKNLQRLYFDKPKNLIERIRRFLHG